MVWNILKSSGGEKATGIPRRSSSNGSLINLATTSPTLPTSSSAKLKSILKVKSTEDLTLSQSRPVFTEASNNNTFDNLSNDHSTTGSRSLFSRGSNSSRSSGSSSRSSFRKSVLARQKATKKDKKGPSQQAPVSPGGGSSASADDSTGHLSADSTQQRTSDSVDHLASAASEGSSTHRSMDKNVRFSDIYIRDYERSVGDNPSCSSGPPIGIGWGYSGTRIVPVDNYERAKGRRRSQLEMILRREQREGILLDWDVSCHEIIDSIRSNVKIKNQRRQTVGNLGKVERLEEAFESAARKLKRTILLRPKTKSKAKQLAEKSLIAQQALASIKIAEQRALDEIHRSSCEEEEPEGDHLGKLDVQVQVSDFCKNSPKEAMLKRNSLRSKSDTSSVAGMTTGNSTTTSVREMENFYRELEQEMFGDGDTPPSMVGKTLEVPGCEIAPEDRRYHDIESVIQEPPSVYGCESTIADTEYADEDFGNEDDRPIISGFPLEEPWQEQNYPTHDGAENNASYVPEQSRFPVSSPGAPRSMLSEQFEYNMEYTAHRRQFVHQMDGRTHEQVWASRFNEYDKVVQDSGLPADHAMTGSSHLPPVRLSSSLEEADLHRNGRFPFPAQPALPISSKTNGVYPEKTTPLTLIEEPETTMMTQNQSQNQNEKQHSAGRTMDGPRVRYCPPPRFVMIDDAGDSPPVSKPYESIVISEDAASLGQDQALLSAIKPEIHDTAYIDGPAVAFQQPVPPPRFPSSFY